MLQVGEYNTEARLVKFLNDNNALVDTAKGNWFEFTNVKFKTCGAQIADSSLEQFKKHGIDSYRLPKWEV